MTAGLVMICLKSAEVDSSPEMMKSRGIHHLKSGTAELIIHLLKLVTIAVSNASPEIIYASRAFYALCLTAVVVLYWAKLGSKTL